MNKLWIVVIFLVVLTLISFLSEKRTKKKVLFLGDSITQAGVEPNGYIALISNMLEQEGIINYDLIRAGIGGNKIYDLYLRMESDVLSKSPNIVVIFIGVNDAWHKKTFGAGTDADKFEEFYRAIVSKLQSAGVKVIVCTPAVIGERNDCGNELDEDLNKYCNIIRSMAADLHLPLVDLRKAFVEYGIQYNTLNVDKGVLTSDRIHLNNKGNQMVAELMWNEIKEIK